MLSIKSGAVKWRNNLASAVGELVDGHVRSLSKAALRTCKLVVTKVMLLKETFDFNQKCSVEMKLANIFLLMWCYDGCLTQIVYNGKKKNAHH